MGRRIVITVEYEDEKPGGDPPGSRISFDMDPPPGEDETPEVLVIDACLRVINLMAGSMNRVIALVRDTMEKG